MSETLTSAEMLLLETLLRRGPLANGELADTLGLSPSSVSVTLGKLLERRVIREIEAGEYAGPRETWQRRKRTFSVSPAIGEIMAVEVDYDFIRLTRLRADLSVISARTIETEGDDPATLLGQLRHELDTELARRGPCLGLGFSLPGRVDVRQAISVRNTRMRDWENVAFSQFRDLCVNVVVENLANAKALGEAFAGNGRQMDDFLFLNVGNGAGMGVFLRGALYRGYRGAAGEAGHVIVKEDAETICTCGNRGCLESYVSNRAVHAGLLRLQSSQVDSAVFSDPDFGRPERVYPLLARHYEEGDKTAYLTVNEVAHRIGLACANFLHLFAPERVFLGGDICALGAEFPALVTQNVRRYHLPWQGPIDISYPADNEHVGARGVACLALRRYLGHEP